MRILVNHAPEDKIYLQNLTFLMKDHGLTGVATGREYDITSIQDTARKANCEAVLLTNPVTLNNLVGSSSLDKYRGTRINYAVPIIVANPIEHIHTVRYGKFLLNSDLRKFKRIKEAPIPFNFLVCDTEETQSQAEAFLSQCLLNSWDIETDDNLQITCISFTGLHRNGSVGCFVFPIVDFNDVHYRTEAELVDTLLCLKRILAQPIPKLAWNGIYDSLHCIRHNLDPLVYLYDAMILGWSKYSELPRGIEFWASMACHDYFYWKDESDKAKSEKDIRGYWAYCGKDSWNTLRIFLWMLSELEPYQVHNYQRTFRLSYPFMYAAFEGIKVNEVARKKVRDEQETIRNEHLRALRIMSANPEFNPGSWQQVHQLIYEIIGAKKLAGRKGAGTDSKTLNRVSMQHPLLARINDHIITYRESAKAISQYCDFDTPAEREHFHKFGDVDPLSLQRLLYNLDPSGTETARAASKASSFWLGTQIQNIPPYAKEFLEADEGNELIELDKNKAEARCVGFLSQCEELIHDIQGQKDFYKVVTERFFKIPYDQVTKQMRNDVTKHIIHGTHHMMGPDPFIDQATPKKIYEAMHALGRTKQSMEEFVKWLLSLYHVDYKRVRQFWYEDVKPAIQLTSMTVSPIGWTRYFFGNINKDHSMFRGAVAHQSQNLNVDILNEEMWNIYNKLVLPSKGELRFKAQIHDSLFFQAKREKALHYAKLIKDMMNTKVIVHGREMVIPVDVKIGKVWLHMKEVSV